jgi:outer membrane protein assembly factor BamB
VGDLVSVDATDGNILWKLHLGTEQRNSSPLYADGKIYAPILNDPEAAANVGGESAEGGHGALYVVQPSDAEGKVLAKVVLDGRCYGTPTPYNGRIYLQTNKKLYCFGPATPQTNAPATDASVSGAPEAGAGVDVWEPEKWPEPGPAVKLQVTPSELLLQPGGKVAFRVRELDANGLTVKEIKAPGAVHWVSYIPPTAKVRASMKASFGEDGELAAAADKIPSAGAFEASADGLKGYIRGRILPALPLRQDFESFNLTEMTTNKIEPPTAFAYPPLPWIGARFKFEVRDRDTNKCLVKTIDNPFFQRATVFMGTPDLKNYTIEADVMSDGNKRKMSEVGVINQHYLVELKGNEQALEITSNQELLRQSVPFSWKPNAWYHLKARVDVAADGSGVIRGKAWKAGEAEPEGWLNELPVHQVETSGCPGLFGFSAQGQRVYIDNIVVAAN